MCDVFFLLNFLNAGHVLAQNINNVHTIFCQFSDVKNGGQSQKPSALCQLVTGESHRTGISCPKES